MADGIEDIYVKLSADTSAFFGQVDKAVNGATSRLNKIGSALTSSAAKWGTAIAGAAAGFATWRGLESAISKTQELGLAVHDLSVRTGMASEESSRWIFAAGSMGMTADSLQRSLGILAKKLKGVQDEETGVTTGGKSTAQVLADIGVKTTDAGGNLLELTDIILPLADRVAAMADGWEKTGLAMQIFGRSGGDMIEFLNLGSKGLQELFVQADKLGVVLSEKNVAAIKAFTFAQRDMTAAINALKLQIGLALMPVLTQFIRWVIDMQPRARVWVQNMIDVGRAIAENVSPVVRTLADDLRSLKDWLEGNRTVLVAFGLALTALVAIAHPLLATIAGLTMAIELYRTSMDDLSPTMAKVKAAVDPLVAGLAQLGDALLTMGSWLLQNQGAMVAAIAGIGVAFLWINPIVALLIGAGGLVYAMGLLDESATGLKAPLDAAGRSAAGLRLELLKTLRTILEVMLALETFGLSAIPGLHGKIQAFLGENGLSAVAEGLAKLDVQIALDQAAINAYDADPMVSQLGHIITGAYQAGGALEYLQRIAYKGTGPAAVGGMVGTIWGAAQKIWAKLAPETLPAVTIPEVILPEVGGAEATKEVTAYTDTLDELTKTLLGLWRTAGATDKEVAGFPWTLDLARRATERLGLTTDDLLDIFNRTGKGFGDFMRQLAASESLDQLKKISDAVVASLSDLRNQFNTLFGAPTREQAAINYQLAQLQLRRAQMVAAGATDEALAGIDKEIARIETINTLRDAEADVMRAQLDLYDKTLLTDAEQYSRGRDLIQRMADMSTAALPVIQLYLDQATAMQGWIDAMNTILFWAAALPLPTAQIPSMQGGGIVPGPRGQPQLILAHGGEPILPVGTGLNFSMPVNINIEQGADWMEITRKAQEAMTEALHQARQRSYLRGAPLGSGIG